MAVHKLINSDNLLLTIPLSSVSEDADRKQIKEDLIETMDHFKGIGLSSNQVGIMERVFVMYSDFTKKVSRLRLDRANKRVTKQRKKLINMAQST